MPGSNRKIRSQIYTEIDIVDVQAGLINRKLGYTPWEWEEELIVLTMDHFQLPFTILIRKTYIRNFLSIQ